MPPAALYVLSCIGQRTLVCANICFLFQFRTLILSTNCVVIESGHQAHSVCFTGLIALHTDSDIQLSVFSLYMLLLQLVQLDCMLHKLLSALTGCCARQAVIKNSMLQDTSASDSESNDG
jgi:hypothetical protein